MEPTRDEEVTVTQARELLGIGHTRCAQLLKEWEETGTGGLPFRTSPLDHRVRLIKISDIRALLQASRGTTVEEARHLLHVSNNKILFLIAAGDLPVRINPLNTKQRLVDPERLEALLQERQAHEKRHHRSQSGDV